jgi:hypothetical protein
MQILMASGRDKGNWRTSAEKNVPRIVKIPHHKRLHQYVHLAGMLKLLDLLQHVPL